MNWNCEGYLANKKTGTYPIKVLDVREQTQEDIISFIDSFGFLSHPEFLKENLCQIVVDNFKELEVDEKKSLTSC
tara:strand:- start:457 stop:681 length:225 start_codon:yes stop_codon:yes gene_type:complete